MPIVSLGKHARFWYDYDSGDNNKETPQIEMVSALIHIAAKQFTAKLM